MKTTSFNFRNLSLLLVIGILATSCMYINRLNGSGHVTKVEHKALFFNKLELGIIFDAVIIPSAEEKVIVETDDNLQQYILVKNEDSTLIVTTQEHVNIGHHSAGKVYIYTKGIEALTNSSVGKLSNEGTLNATNFVFNNSSVGSTDLKIEAKKITIDNSAVGKTNLYLKSDTLTLNNSAVGKMLLTGSTILSTIDNSGVGKFDSQFLITQVLHITNSGVGKCDISAEKEFYIVNSGVGKLDAYGSGVIKSLDDSGITKTSKH